MKLAEGKMSGPISFSDPVPHGTPGSEMGTVMMTRIEMEDQVFVHASDIQLLDDNTVDLVIGWRPDIVLAAGPPLYLNRLDKDLVDCAWKNARRLAKSTKVLILDHHLMRGKEGVVWLDTLSKIVGRRIYCAADYMKQPRKLFEAERLQLYEKIPVPDGWHDAYANGSVDPDDLLKGFF